MSLEPSERLAGVGALIVTPCDRALTVVELSYSERTIKEVGMRTHPMESTEDGELPDQVLERLFIEEVRFNPSSLLELVTRLCTVQINRGLWVAMYLYVVDLPSQVEIGTASHEVSSPDWIPIDEVLESEIGSNRFRPGFRETVKSFRDYQNKNGNFRPQIFDKTEDGDLVLARIRQTTSQKPGLYQHPYLMPGLTG